jgi:hypothetical protein
VLEGPARPASERVAGKATTMAWQVGRRHQRWVATSRQDNGGGRGRGQGDAYDVRAAKQVGPLPE